MRDWRGTRYHDITDPIARDAIAEVSDFLFQIGPSFQRINQGQQSDSTGTPLPMPDLSVLDNFVFMPGRGTDQIVNSLNATNVGLTIKGNPSQSVDIFRVRNNSLTDYLCVGFDGQR